MKKRLSSSVLIGFIVAGFLCLPAQSTQAFTTQFFEGTVADVFDDNGANPFGLSLGDTIYLKAVFDPAEVTSSPLVPGSDEQLSLAGHAGWDFRITLGAYRFAQSDLSALDQTDTNFWFYEGALDGIEFYHLDDIGIFPDVFISHFSAAQSLFAEWGDSGSGDPYFIEADWDFTPVPLPGTLLLLGSGLLGLTSIRKKFKRM